MATYLLSIYHPHRSYNVIIIGGSHMQTHQEFTNAINQRTAHPLRFGAYKLREAALQFDRFENELLTLQHCKKNKLPMAGRCTHGDQAKWLKDLPSKTIPYILGYYVLPAIKALDGDSVPASLIQQRLPYFIAEIGDLLTKCDEAYCHIRKCIGFEYELWDEDESLLMPLILDAQHLIGLALEMVPPPPKIQFNTQHGVHGV